MKAELQAKLMTPNAERLFYIGDALRTGMTVEEISAITKIDPWFLYNIKEIIELEKSLAQNKDKITRELLIAAKEMGFSERQLATIWGKKEEEVYSLRKSFQIKPEFKLVDTCAAEFKARTPYYYSTYEQ